MACACGDRRQHWNDRRQAILDSWSTDRFTATPDKFVTSMIYYLQMRRTSWEIVGVTSDMWMAIKLEGKGYKECPEELEETITDEEYDAAGYGWQTRVYLRVECDRFEDGLVALYEHIQEHYPESDDE